MALFGETNLHDFAALKFKSQKITSAKVIFLVLNHLLRYSISKLPAFITVNLPKNLIAVLGAKRLKFL